MAEEKIEIKLVVDNKQATQVLDQFGKQVESVKEKTEDASGVSSNFFAGIAKGAASAIAAYATLKTAIGAVEVGSQIADVNNAFERLTRQIGVSADELQNRFTEALGGTLSAFDTTRKANELLVAGINPDKFDELAQAARALADTLGIDTAQALDQVSSSLLRGNDRALKAIGVHVDFTKANKDLADSLGVTVDQLSETQKLEAGRSALIAEMEKQLARLGKVENDAADNLVKIGNNLRNVRDDMLEAIATNKTLNEALQFLADIKLDSLKAEINNISLGFQTLFNVIKTGSWTTGYLKTMSEMMEKQRIEQEKLAKANQVIVGTEKAHERSLFDLLDTTTEKLKKQKEEKELLDAMKKMYGENTTETNKNAKAVKELTTAYANADSHVEKYLKTREEELQLIREAQGEYEQLQRELHQQAKEQGVFGDLFDMSKIAADLTTDPNLQAAYEQAGLALSDSLFRGLASAINGDKMSKEEIGREIGGGIGRGIGAYFGMGEAGQMLGDAIGGAIANMDADSAGTALKKQLDKILTDAYQDFTFSGNQDPTKGIFAGLGEQAQEQFNIAGDALTKFLGGSTDLGVNLGVVLANNNVHLAELQSIIESVGGSFESLADTMYMAFYDGEISVLQLQDRLEELYGLMDGSSAFQDLGDAARSALSEDGRVLLAAIKAIGKEAEQLGISTFPQMASVLVNQFGLAADQVQAILASISAAGIKSINELASAGNNVAVAVGANLSQINQGLAPTNTPVAQQPTTAPTRASGSSSGSRSAPARRTENKAEKARRELAQLFNKVQSSQRGRELEKQIADGIITDGQYVTALQGMVNELKPLLKQLDSEEKQYLEALRKGKDNKKIEKELADFVNLEKKISDPLGGSSKAGISINTEFLDYINKFGDALGGLEIAAKNAGIAFQSMEEQAFNAFLSGSKTFAEAKKQLDDARGGVAGKQGAVGEALQKYLEAGTSGGVFSLKALQGIAGEVKELGATTLDNLSEALLGQGIDREVVQKLFIGFQNAGIESLEEIENAGAEMGITLGAILQDLNFPFKETSSTIRQMAQELAQIPNSKKVEIELSAIVDPKTQAILDQLGLLPEGFNNTDVTTQPYDDTALGIRKRKQAKYQQLLKAGRKADAKRFKQNNAQYF